MLPRKQTFLALLCLRKSLNVSCVCLLLSHIRIDILHQIQIYSIYFFEVFSSIKTFYSSDKILTILRKKKINRTWGWVEKAVLCSFNILLYIFCDLDVQFKCTIYKYNV